MHAYYYSLLPRSAYKKYTHAQGEGGAQNNCVPTHIRDAMRDYLPRASQTLAGSRLAQRYLK